MKIKIGNKTFEVSKEKFDGSQEEIVIGENLIIRTPDEESSFIENHKKDARKEGLEIAVKKQREALGLDFQGKTIENLIKAAQKKAIDEASIEPNEQITTLKKTLEDKDTALQNAINKQNEINSNFINYKNQNIINSKIDALIPDTSIIPKEDMRMIIKNKMSFDVDEKGSIIIKDSSGNVLKNETTADPLKVDDAVNDFFRTNNQYLGGNGQGKGGVDSKGSGSKQTLDDFIAEQKDKGIGVGSPEFQAELNKRNESGLIEM